MEYAQLNPAETNIHRMPDEVKSDARRTVQETPWAAVGIGFGAGVVFGALVVLLARKA